MLATNAPAEVLTPTLIGPRLSLTGPARAALLPALASGLEGWQPPAPLTRPGLPPLLLHLRLPPGEEPRALLLVTAPEAARLPGPDTLRAAFGLTPAEARVALALARGEDAAAIAAAAGTSPGTVRVQVKAVLGKTGTPRQAALVALLHRMAGPIPSGR